MNILLVDDQTSVLNGILSGVNWSQIGVSEVKLACSAMMAREVIQKEPIDLMFCDIEMPGENGISLLHWIRQKNMDIECIFLTAHADFIYAKEAIQLGAFGYILQPARYDEIKNAVTQVAEHIYKKREEKSFCDYGRITYQKRVTSLQDILDKWLTAQSSPDNSIFRDLHQLGIDIQANSRIFFVLTQILFWYVDPLSVGNWNLTLEKMFYELFEKVGCHILFLHSDQSSFPFVVYSQSLISLEMMAKQLEQAMRICKEKLKFELAVYTSRAFNAKRLGEYVIKAQNMKCKNLIHTQGIFFTDYNEDKNISLRFNHSYLQRWVRLLKCGKAQMVEKLSIGYLKELENKRLLNKEALYSFYQDLQRVIEKITGRDNQSADEILRQREIRILSEKACDSTENMIAFIKALTPFYIFNKNSTEIRNKIVSQIRNYVKNNLEKTFTCRDIANSMYLNSDYISRIFHRETGTTLKDYIIGERMETAQKLINSTKLPIGIIAAKVGFSNFSHFSQVYKKTFGITPSDVRK